MDYYKILELSSNASPEEIKKSYRKLAMKHHPDRNGGNDAHFKKIQEAYEVLRDPTQRHQYDNPNLFKGENSNTYNNDINDIFGQIFRRASKQIIKAHVTLSLVDAYNGSSHFIQLNTATLNKLIKLDMPAGTQHGSSLRYDNIADGITLVVYVNILSDSRFERRGNDLFSTHTISVFDLILGSKFKFNTISGKTIEVKVNEKTQPNTQLRVPNAGMPNGKGEFGDQFILINAIIPDSIDNEILEIIAKHVK